MADRRTASGPGTFEAPENASEIAPSAEPGDGRKPPGRTLTVSVAGPVPDAGVTWSQGRVAVAVQVTVPEPVCRKATVCGEVAATNDEPSVTAPNRRIDLSSVIVGPEDRRPG